GAKWTIQRGDPDMASSYLCVKFFMKHLTILVPEGKGNNISSIIGSYKIFTRANAYWKESGRKEPFTIELAGTTKKVEYFDGLFSVKPHTHISKVAKTHLIIIPSLNHKYQKTLKKNILLVNWIEQQYVKGTEVASICTGAYLLAA